MHHPIQSEKMGPSMFVAVSAGHLFHQEHGMLEALKANGFEVTPVTDWRYSKRVNQQQRAANRQSSKTDQSPTFKYKLLHKEKEFFMKDKTEPFAEQFSRVSNELMRLKSIQKSLEADIPEKFKHHWTNLLEQYLNQKNTHPAINEQIKAESIPVGFQDIDNHLKMFRQELGQTVDAIQCFVRTKQAFDQNKSFDLLEASLDKRMELYYRSARAIHQLNLALEIGLVIKNSLVDSTTSEKYYQPLCATIDLIDIYRSELSDLLSNPELKPVEVEVYALGHAKAHSQSIDQFINQLDTLVFGKQYSARFYPKNDVVLKLDKEKATLRHHQIDTLKSVSELAPSDAYRLIAMQLVIKQIESEQCQSRLLDQLRMKVAESKRFGIVPVAPDMLKEYLDEKLCYSPTEDLAMN